MSGRYIPPDHPRAIFAGDAERDMERLRAQQPAAPRGRFAPPLRRDPPTTPPPQQQPAQQQPDITALRARAAALAPAPGERREGPDPGEIIAEIPRPDGTVLRVAVKRWHNPDAPADAPPAVYVDVRLWSGAWPVKGKGVSVKPRELAALASALLDAAEKLSADRRGAR